MILLAFTAAAATDNTTALFAWGHNDSGEVAPVVPFDRQWAQPVRNQLGRIVAVDTTPTFGYVHVLALRDDGTVLAWGDTSFGQIGNGAVGGNTVIPQVVPIGGVVAVAASVRHSLALTGSGEVWAWGDNSAGQLGTGTIGGVVAWPVPVANLPLPAIGIAAAGQTSAALLSDGTVWTWGSDANNQLGDGVLGGASRAVPGPTSLPARAVGIDGGADHLLALLDDGTVAAWGANWYSQQCSTHAGIPTSPWPTRIEDGWGQPFVDVVEISAGNGSTFVRKADGSVHGCGRNDIGQLPGVSGGPAVLAIALPALQGVVDIDIGNAAGLARTTDGTVLAWGACGYGTCGTGSGLTDPWHVVPTPTVVEHVHGAVAISAGGSNYAVADRPGTELHGTGGNGYGQLGDFTTVDRGEPVLVDPFSGWGGATGVAGGYTHSVAVSASGHLFGWGANRVGQVGDGTYSDRWHPEWIRDLDAVAEVAAGTEFSMALRHDGTVWVWGSNAYGQHGAGGSGGDSPVPVRADIDGVVAIAAGHYHAVALRADGTVWAWGDVMTDEIGYAPGGWIGGRPTEVLVDPAVGISAGWAHTLILDRAGDVWAFGANDVGQLGNGTIDPMAANRYPPGRASLSGAIDIAAGGWLSMATLSDDSVVRWGDDIRNPRWLECVPNGGLGDALPVPVGRLQPALDIAAGWCHGVVLTRRHDVWAFGSGRGGALGDGGWSDSITPVRMLIDGVDAIGPAGGHTELIVYRPRITPPCNPKDPSTCG